jgi:hypothetical protein
MMMPTSSDLHQVSPLADKDGTFFKTQRVLEGMCSENPSA